MWMNARIFNALQLDLSTTRFDLATSRAEARILCEQLASARTTMEWLSVRITQVEHERAAFMQKLTGISIITPSIQYTAPTLGAAGPLGMASDPLAELPSFQDMGDEAAIREGVMWNADGSVRYTK